MLLHEEHVGAGGMHREPMLAVPDLRIWIGNAVRYEAAVDRLPRRSAAVAAKHASRRNRDKDAPCVLGV